MEIESRDSELTWEELQDCIKRLDIKNQLLRSPQIVEAYKKLLVQVEEEYVSVADFVQEKYFGYKCVLEGKKKKAVPTTDEIKIVWVVNDFPYYFSDGIDHYIIWSSQALTDSQIEDTINQHLSKNEYEIIPFRNYVNPSIPQVYHLHVFSRKRK